MYSRLRVGLVLAVALATLGSASRTATRGDGVNPGTQTRVVVQPSPLFVSSGKRFATAAEALSYCGDGSCSTPRQLESLYDMNPLYAKGDTGRGVTIAVVDSFGSPTIVHDLTYFDRMLKLPNPPSFTVIRPAGKVPPFNPQNSSMEGWATEATLDVEYAHAMAPGASILLVETPVDETEGTAGFPQIEAAEEYVIDHHLASVITQSFGATEQTFPSKRSLLSLRMAYIDAETHNVTVIAASGDEGAADIESSTPDAVTYFTHRAVDWPASDPLVTGVGGTFVNQAEGRRTESDSVWNTSSQGAGPFASGGGLSVVFERPGWQNGVIGKVGGARGLPDVAMEASPQDAALVYSSMPGQASGFSAVGGTSEAAPLFAGIVAVADQVAGVPLGFLNPALYALGASNAPGLVDVETGNNTVGFNQNGRNYTVRGWIARPGFDLASGWGTIDGAEFVGELTAWERGDRNSADLTRTKLGWLAGDRR